MRSLVFIGLILYSHASFAQNNSNSKAEVPTKLSYLQIDPEIWKVKKGIKHTKTVRIDKIIDPLTIILKDETVIRLASIDIPNDKNSDWNIQALAYLNEMLPERTEVMLYQTRNAKSGRVNRMNHQLAHLIIKDKNIWVQGSLLNEGFARIYTAPNQDELLDDMRAAENKAIDEQKNIWGKATPFAIKTPENLDDLIGEFVVVEGTVQKVANIKNNAYLNFGKDWKTDFTVMLTSDNRRELSKNGLNAQMLAHKPVRIRGWLREYNGPLIELEDISHLQILPNPSNLPTTTENNE
ncbi:MAG: thermonuclease family protein [Pseudomonadota bacterium]